MSQYLNDMLLKLTDNLNKNTDGNIGKLFNIVSDELEEVKTVYDTILAWRDIDTAEGVVLDMIGKNLGQARGSFTDKQYRILLKSKYRRSTSKGDIDTLIETLAAISNADVTDIVIKEIYPASIHIEMPVIEIESGILDNPEIILGFIKSFTAAGIEIIDPVFGGMFTFNETDSEDENMGFFDLDQQTGGFLGWVY